MILAEKIFALRRNAGYSQEELAEKLNVSRQSVSKWESASSIPDIGKIIELSKLFGVTTDYLLKDDLESPAFSGEDDVSGRLRVSVQEANGFVADYAVHARRTALGVALCILSLVPLILLEGIAEAGSWGARFTANAAEGIGVTALFSVLATGVVMLIISSQKMRKYEYLKKAGFELQYGVEGIVRAKWSAFEGRYAAHIAIGVALCILCPLPLIISDVTNAPEPVPALFAALLFVLVAVAVYLFVTASMVKESFDRLLGEGKYTRAVRVRNRRQEKFGGIYWPCMTAVYLAWSFISRRWDITWVIWPVAGLLFAGISAALGGDQE